MRKRLLTQPAYPTPEHFHTEMFPCALHTDRQTESISDRLLGVQLLLQWSQTAPIRARIQEPCPDPSLHCRRRSEPYQPPRIFCGSRIGYRSDWDAHQHRIIRSVRSRRFPRSTNPQISNASRLADPRLGCLEDPLAGPWGWRSPGFSASSSRRAAIRLAFWPFVTGRELRRRQRL